MFICFACVIIIAKSGTENINAENSEDSSTSSLGHLIGLILIFLQSWCIAILFVANRFLKGINVYAVMFYHGAFGLITGLIYLFIAQSMSEDFFSFLKYTPMQYLIILISCLSDSICI